jgi:hypothetical protein
LLLRRPKKKMLPRKGGFGVDGSRGRRKMVGRVGGAGLGSLKMGEDERKGRGAAPFVLWFWPGKRGLEQMRGKGGGCPGLVLQERGCCLCWLLLVEGGEKSTQKG